MMGKYIKINQDNVASVKNWRLLVKFIRLSSNDLRIAILRSWYGLPAAIYHELSHIIVSILLFRFDYLEIVKFYKIKNIDTDPVMYSCEFSVWYKFPDTKLGHMFSLTIACSPIYFWIGLVAFSYMNSYWFLMFYCFSSLKQFWVSVRDFEVIRRNINFFNKKIK
jgi:hypothetical protein